MKFFDREQEIKKIREITLNSKKNAQFTVITGRRRIGKTQLLLNACNNKNTLYFFITRKAESFLCQDFVQEINKKLNNPIIGNINDFGSLFKYLMELSINNHFTLILDEFQEFYNINPSVYSEMQKYWDLYKEKSKINLIVCGSIYSLMHKIFKDYKAPLFGRASSFIQIKSFKVSVLKNILNDLNPNYKPEDLLALYAFTGGVAKYVQLLADNKALKYSKMLDYIISEDSPFITDGKNMLIDEFGKDYAIYFTILSFIANGYNTRSVIEASIDKEVGGYLTRLENDYGLIEKKLPLFSKNESKNVRYSVKDNFLTFWFRFIFKYSHILEISQYDELKKIIERDYTTFSVIILERYFIEKYIEDGNITRIGSYWDKSGENEIDMIVLNESKKIAYISEIKRNKKKININIIKQKTEKMIIKTNKLKDYKLVYNALSLEDM